jgi:hypothetical protein
MEDIMERLTTAVADLQATEQIAAEKRAIRDHLIKDALDNGATWSAVQHATGMGPRGIALSLKRIAD